MQVRDYFLELQNLLQHSPVVKTVDVEYELKSRTIGVVHGTVGMVDGSTLHFLELIVIPGAEIVRPKYRFQFMDRSEKIIFRYDNTPHHPEVETHPHHKHTTREERPRPSKEMELPEILAEMSNCWSDEGKCSTPGRISAPCV
jgi:hypothetical protein